MLSERKLAANRLNAQKSTGPRTSAGKERASLNALKTGIFCGGKSVLPGESQSDYDALRDSIFSAIDQDDPIELVLAERMVAARWKIARLSTAERRMHQEQSEDLTRELNAPVCKVFVRHFDDWDKMSRHEQRLENQFFRALRELRQWRAQKRKPKNEPTADGVTHAETERSAVPDSADSSSTAPTSEKGENEPTADASIAQMELHHRPMVGESVTEIPAVGDAQT